MKVDFTLGDTQVSTIVHQNRSERPTMLNVHTDEHTSVEAGKVSIQQYGGRLIELVHSGGRLITFSLDKKTFVFDPNRMFSDAGIVATLRKHSTYSEAAHMEIKSFGIQFVKRFSLEKEPVIIALHNTVDGIFSVESFVPGAELGSEAAAVHVNLDRSKFDFYYVTDRRFHDYLKDRKFNVVLQDNEQVTDDGSLSVYFAQKKIPYINVEAEMNHLDNQIEMVKVAREMLKDPAVRGGTQTNTSAQPQ
jgi:hypothetical protein